MPELSDTTGLIGTTAILMGMFIVSQLKPEWFGWIKRLFAKIFPSLIDEANARKINAEASHQEIRNFIEVSKTLESFVNEKLALLEKMSSIQKVHNAQLEGTKLAEKKYKETIKFLEERVSMLEDQIDRTII